MDDDISVKHTFFKPCHTKSQKEKLTDTSIFIYRAPVLVQCPENQALIKFIELTVSHSYTKLNCIL